MALTPGEKLTLIKRSAQGVADETWESIRLSLQLFNVPDVSPQGNVKYDYVARRLAEATDGELLAFHAHLYPDTNLGPSSSDAGPWAARHLRLFLSHAHEHKVLAGEIRDYLSRWAVDVFVAHDTIEPSREWQDEIESALGTADALAALLTPEFVHSRWCDQEVGFCLARGIPLVPITYGAMPHGFIGKFQGLRAEDRSIWFIGPNLFRILATHEGLEEKMDWPIVQRYAWSRNFDGTREAFELLKRIPAERWTEEMIAEVETEALQNKQVSDAVALNPSRPMTDAVRQHLDELLGREAKPDQVTSGSEDDISLLNPDTHHSIT